jgi:apolipoprotein N-acyltransferase
VFAPDGSMGRIYGKRHLVPFGERMPFEWLLPGLAKIDLGQAEWTPGPGAVLFPVPGLGPFACLICFESIFPDLSRESVRAGAQWLVNITNDEWFGNGPALPQHAAMAQFRAVENHVPLARCANTGITEIVDSAGRVTARLPVFRAGVLVHPLPPPGRPTPYTRLGDWPGAAALIASGVLLLLAFARRRAAVVP